MGHLFQKLKIWGGVYLRGQAFIRSENFIRENTVLLISSQPVDHANQLWNSVRFYDKLP